MKHHAYIIGHNAMDSALERQLALRGYGTLRCQGTADNLALMKPDDLCIVLSEDDNAALRLLEQWAESIKGEALGFKPHVQLVLRDEATYQVLLLADFSETVKASLDVEAFTRQRSWAQCVMCPLPAFAPSTEGTETGAYTYPPLDGPEGISAESECRVHLVVDGWNDWAAALAETATLVAHFPNFVRNNTLRTRITIISPDAGQCGAAFRQRHPALFAHSHYRTVAFNAKGEPCVTELHRPFYSGSREDFVDVEWDFISAPLSHPAVRTKLAKWATNAQWQLTLALCGESDKENVETLLGLPAELTTSGTTVLVRQHDDALLRTLRHDARFAATFPFGMDATAYDTSLPYVRMARLLNCYYAASYGGRNDVYNFSPDDEAREWANVPSFALRASNVSNVLTFPTKMRSLGHRSFEPHTFYALSQKEVETLSAVEHNRWSVERLLAGFRPPTDEEREKIRTNIEAHIRARREGNDRPDTNLKRMFKNERHVHFDLCAYSELECDATGRDVKIYDYDLTASIPILAERFLTRSEELPL